MDEQQRDRLRMTSQVDQAVQGLSEHARQMAGYHVALMDQGFKRAEALQLVRDYQTAMLMAMFGQRKDG